MILKEPVMTVQKNLGEMLNKIEYKHDSIIITRAGRPTAAIIDMPLFNKIKKLQENFVHLTNELQTAFTDIPEEQTEKLIEEAQANFKAKEHD